MNVTFVGLKLAGVAALYGAEETPLLKAAPIAGTTTGPRSIEETAPFFSIVVPTYARPDALGRCLRALGELEYPPSRHEIIVVDDGSAGPYRRRIEATCAEAGARLVSKPHGGPAAARNVGSAHARGDYLAFVDDDCEPAPDWLARLAAQFAAEPDAAIGGRTLNGLPANLYSVASQLLVDYLYLAYRDEGRGEPRFLASNNIAFPRRAFEAVGRFDLTFPLAAGEDRELCDRWHESGRRLVYVPDAVVYHSHALTWSGFCRQHFNYGRGAFRFRRAREANGRDRVQFEGLRFYANLIMWPLRQRPLSRSAIVSTLLVGTQAANAAGFFFEATLTGLRRWSGSARRATLRGGK
jgi:cellulose synthase/poly-beta-1,6-N-acetylglucosamine synthase-like glycosyltransferase